MGRFIRKCINESSIREWCNVSHISKQLKQMHTAGFPFVPFSTKDPKMKRGETVKVFKFIHYVTYICFGGFTATKTLPSFSANAHLHRQFMQKCKWTHTENVSTTRPNDNLRAYFHAHMEMKNENIIFGETSISNPMNWECRIATYPKSWVEQWTF